MKLFYKNKNVLVTGGTGLIGTQLVNKLVKLKSRVIVTSLDKNIELPKGVEFIRSDLRFFENCLVFRKTFFEIFCPDPLNMRRGRGQRKTRLSSPCPVRGLSEHSTS